MLCAGIAAWQSPKLNTVVAMLLLAAIPATYLSFIMFSGLDAWIYAKISGEEQLRALKERQNNEDVEKGGLIYKEPTQRQNMMV